MRHSSYNNNNNTSANALPTASSIAAVEFREGAMPAIASDRAHELETQAKLDQVTQAVKDLATRNQELEAQVKAQEARMLAAQHQEKKAEAAALLLRGRAAGSSAKAQHTAEQVMASIDRMTNKPLPMAAAARQPQAGLTLDAPSITNDPVVDEWIAERKRLHDLGKAAARVRG